MTGRPCAISWQTCALLPFLLCSSPAVGNAQDPVTAAEAVRRHDRAVFVLSEGLSPDDRSACSAALVSTDRSLFLIAPRVKWGEGKTRIGIPMTSDQASQWSDVKDVSDWSAGDPRHHFPEHGISILPLHSSDVDLDHLRRVAIPVTAFQPTVPTRGTRLDIVGFPIRLAPDFTDVPPAFTWTSAVASKELKLPKFPSGFLAAPPGSRLFTGAPVFLHSEREDDIAYAGSVVVCLPHDSDSSNWALILPAATIRQLIESLETTTEGNTAK